MVRINPLRIIAIAAATIILPLLATCGEWKAPQLEWASPVSSQEEHAFEGNSEGDDLPFVLELDALVVGGCKSVRQGDQVISYGSDYDPEISFSTSDREESIEVEDTSLNLRAYEVGDYTYAIIAQLVGDGGFGGGQDDDIPLNCLIDTDICEFGGGQDDEIPLFYYLGFADYTFGTWRWYGPFATADPEIALNNEDLEDRFKSPTDMLYIAVLTVSTGKGASQLPTEGLVGGLPFEPTERTASQLEDPVGVRVNLVTTNIDSGIGTLPQIVTGLEAVVGGSSITLSWDENPDPHVTKHQAFRQNLTIGDPVETLGDVPMPLLEYEDTTAVVDTTYRYSVRAVNDTGDGGLGEIEVGPPIIKAVGPHVGTEGTNVTFAIAVDGSEPFIYLWNFGGGAEPDTSTDARPNVTLGEVGEYAAWVSIDNAYGHDSLDFVLTVNEAPMWHVTLVDDTEEVGWCSAITIVNGHPAITYQDGFNEELKYARALDAYGTSWGTPITIDEEYAYCANSIAVLSVSNYPAIAYRDNGCGLNYARATDVNGSSWGAPVEIDMIDYMNYSMGGLSMAIIGGRPAISFIVADSDLMYVRATDVYGSSWGDPVTVEDKNNIDVGMWYCTSLAVVNGYPAISYCDRDSLDLMYVRATNSDGSSWSAPITVDSAGDVGVSSRLAMVNGYPAISHIDFTNGNLKFIRAMDIDGNGWGVAVNVDSTGSVDYDNSLVLVNGYPAIAYSGGVYLKYVQATNSSGSLWGTPVIVDSSPSINHNVYATVIENHPAVCYFDIFSDNLWFAIYL